MHKETQKLKIAVVIDSYTHGGVALALKMFLQFLAKENYDITLFVRDFNAEKLLPVPENVTCLPWEDVAFSLKNKINVLLNWRNYGKKVAHGARCRKMFPGEFDCAVGYQMISNAVTVVTLEKICAKRKVLWLHGKKRFNDKDLPFYDELYSKADNIVCVSLETEERFKRLMPKSADRTVTIHNFYDIPFIRAQAEGEPDGMDVSSKAVKIVSVGRISKEKGFDRVPPAAEKLVRAGYDFQWYIIGDGAKKAEVDEAVQKLGLADRVHMLGYRENPYPYMKHCDIYVQPSYSEGFCTSTMEAKILCKPVVTTDVPGMREQFEDGVNGLIVESSVEGIFEGVHKLIESAKLRGSITAKLRSEPISNDEALQQTMKVIDGAE